MIRRRLNIQSQLDAVNQAAAQALASAQSASGIAVGAELALPQQRPSFAIDLVNARFLDPQIQVSRNSIGTYFDKYGMMRVSQPNKTRFNHSLSTKNSLGILNESKSTNYIVDSYNFASSKWNKSKCTIQNGSKKSIFSSTVQRIVCDGTNDPYISQNISLSENNLVLANQKCTFSVYLWTDEAVSTKVRLWVYGTGAEASINNVYTITNVPTKVELTQSFPANFASTTITVRIDPFDGETNQPDAGRYLNIDCAQFETLGFSTSYIPTTSAPATREKDTVLSQGNSFSTLFANGVEEGTMLIVTEKGQSDGTYSSYWHFAGPNTAGGMNSIRLTNLVAPNTGVTAALYADGVSYSPFGFEAPIGSLIQCAFAWKKGDAKIFVNNLSSADLNVQVPTNINQFRIEDINGHIKQIMFWPTRLPNAQLQALVTGGLFGLKPNQAPVNEMLLGSAYLNPYALLRSTNRQHFTIDGTGASVTRNIRFNFDFDFEIVDSSGCSITSQPSASCVANTDNALVFSAPLGKSLTYAVTPKFEY